MLAAGTVSARELLDAHLHRIDAANGILNAIVTLVPELAQERAAAADAAHAEGDTLGVLHGLPIAHKDLTETAGIRTTYGSPATATYVPEENSLLVERLHRAGAVPVGKDQRPRTRRRLAHLQPRLRGDGQSVRSDPERRRLEWWSGSSPGRPDDSDRRRFGHGGFVAESRRLQQRGRLPGDAGSGSRTSQGRPVGPPVDGRAHGEDGRRCGARAPGDRRAR